MPGILYLKVHAHFRAITGIQPGPDASDESSWELQKYYVVSD